MNSLELLQAYFKKEVYEFSGDVKREITLQNLQSLSPFLYYVYGKPFLNVYLAANLIQEKFYKLQSEITKILNENQISHFYFKGSVLSNIYPDNALRTRGDIDFIVKKEDFSRAKALLLENGFDFFDECDHHASYFKNELEVELHKSLIHSDSKFYKYFEKPFEMANVKNEYEYEMSPEYHYLFLLVHLNKHITTGEGLRSLLDFYYMDKYYNLDYDFIINESKKINLTKLFHTVNNAVYIITGERLYGYNGEDVSDFLEYLLNNGIHGRSPDANYGENLVLRKGNGGGKIRTGLNAIFLPDKKVRKKLYPRLSKCFIFYPILVIHRAFVCVFFRRRALKALVGADLALAKKNDDMFGRIGVVED